MKRTTPPHEPHNAKRYRGLCLRAALLCLAYGAVHLAGWREGAGFLSGTMMEGHSLHETLVRGTLYLLAHLGFWVLAPILAIGAALTALDDRWLRGGRP